MIGRVRNLIKITQRENVSSDVIIPVVGHVTDNFSFSGSRLRSPEVGKFLIVDRARANYVAGRRPSEDGYSA